MEKFAYSSPSHLVNINVSDCSALKNLNLRGSNLTNLDLTGCYNLTSLNCSNNNLSHLDLSDCTGLENLNCSENQLSYLDLSVHTDLEDVDCSANEISLLDVSSSLNLNRLLCSDNNLTNLDVSECSLLWWLFCGSNPIPFLDLSNNFYLCATVGHGWEIVSDPWVNLSNMPDLYEVCIFDTLSIPDSDTIEWNVNFILTGSPNAYLTTHCSMTDLPVKNSDLRFYPNPVSDQLFLEFNSDFTGQTRYELIDMKGAVILSGIEHNPMCSLDLSSLQKGLYLIRISSENYTLTEKVVKVE